MAGPTESEIEKHEAWLRDRCPNELDGDRAWGWITNQESGRKDIFYLHRCKEGRLALGTINTQVHQLVAEDPLHVEPSILCTACGDHGFIREGRWENA